MLYEILFLANENANGNINFEGHIYISVTVRNSGFLYFLRIATLSYLFSFPFAPFFGVLCSPLFVPWVYKYHLMVTMGALNECFIDTFDSFHVFLIHWYVDFSCCCCLVTSIVSDRLCDPMDCSPPGSSVHGILQARVLEWVAMPSSRGSSRLRDGTSVSCIAGRFFTSLGHQGSPPLFHIYVYI